MQYTFIPSLHLYQFFLKNKKKKLKNKMGKRPRTPHFITGIGDGNVNLRSPDNKHNNNNNIHNKNPATGSNAAKRERYNAIRKRDERLIRLEEPLAAADQWRDVFGSGDPDLVKAPAFASDFLSISPFWVLGMIVVVSAIGLHMLSDSSSQPTARYRRRQRQRRMYRTRKKKTDEWSDDEEILQDPMGYSSNHNKTTSSGDGKSEQQQLFYPHYYHQPPAAIGSMYSSQEHRLRRTSTNEPNSPVKMSGGGGSNYYLPNQGVVPAYKSPAANMMHMNQSGVHRRGVSPKHSYTSSSQGTSPIRRMNPLDTPDSFSSDAMGSPGGYLPPVMGSPYRLPVGSPSSRMRVHAPLDAADFFPPSDGGAKHHSGRLQAQGENSDLPQPPPAVAPRRSTNDPIGTIVRPLDGNFSSFESLTNSINQNDEATHTHGSFQGSQQHGLDLASSSTYEETPLIVNRKTFATVNSSGTPGINFPPAGLETSEKGQRIIPFIPSLNVSSHHNDNNNRVGSQLPSIRPGAPPAPPRSMTIDDLRLVQMETGGSNRWGVNNASSAAFNTSASDNHASFYEDDFSVPSSEESSAGGDSNISIPSGDPRKCIIHKRKDLTIATDASTSLQSTINFEELKLVEVIGGGGFGQVWKASWRGTPVAVKVLTGGAQTKHIAKAILEEFKAEINLLKVRHKLKFFFDLMLEMYC